MPPTILTGYCGGARSGRDGQCSARLFREHRERSRIANGEIRENLAIDFDAGLLEPVHEHTVAHVVLMRRGIDADDPELPKLALLVLAIAIGVDPAALDVFLRGLPELRAGAERTARRLHDLLLTLQSNDVALYAWHSSLLYACRRRFMRLMSPLVAIRPARRRLRFRLGDFFVRMWLL